MGLTGGFRLLPPAWVAIVFHFSGIIIVWGILVKKKGTKTSVTGCGSFLLQKFFRAFLFWRFFLIISMGNFGHYGLWWPLIITTKGAKTFFIILKTPLGTGFLFFIGYPPMKNFLGKYGPYTATMLASFSGICPDQSGHLISKEIFL